jgi:ribosome-interacting GTPase 1
MMPYETIQIQLIDTPSISSDFYENYMTNLIRTADLALLIVDISSLNILTEVHQVLHQLESRKLRLVSAMPTTLDDARLVYKKTIIVGHKSQEDFSSQGMEMLQGIMSSFNILATSIIDDESMATLKDRIFRALEIIRVYTKRVGHEAELIDPIILPVGGTVEDAALTLHKDFARQLQFARVWGKGKFEGQRVKSSFVLSDGDIIEFHI